MRWVIEVWGIGWKEAIMKTSVTSGPMTWEGWVIMGKEKISLRNKRIGANHNNCCVSPSWWFSVSEDTYWSKFVKTGFTSEVTPSKSRVEGGWDLASPYVVCPCLHTQWSHISGLVGGGDKDLSWGVNKPVGVGLSRLSEWLEWVRYDIQTKV